MRGGTWFSENSRIALLSLAEITDSGVFLGKPFDPPASLRHRNDDRRACLEPTTFAVSPACAGRKVQKPQRFARLAFRGSLLAASSAGKRHNGTLQHRLSGSGR